MGSLLLAEDSEDESELSPELELEDSLEEVEES